MYEIDEIQQATRAKEAATAALFDPFGRKVFADAQHRERLQSIQREFGQEMDKIQAGIEERIQRAREQLLAEEHGDAAASLSTAELERAGAMHAFIAEDAENISNAALIERARAALASKDKPRMYVLQHVAAQRLNRSPDSDLGGELLDVAGELRAGLDPEAEFRLEVAKADLEEAEDLQFRAQLARAGATSIADLGGGQGQASSGYWTAGAAS